MKKLLQIAITIILTYGISIGILYFINSKTAPKIAKIEAAKLEAQNQNSQVKGILKKLMPDADEFEKIGLWTIHEKKAEIYKAKKGSSTAGYCIQSYGVGYSGLINTMIAVDTKGIILKVDILEQTETPGLGDRVLEDDFKNKLIGKDVAHCIVRMSDAPDVKEYVEAITASTISSRAITEDAVKSALTYLQATIIGK